MSTLKEIIVDVLNYQDGCHHDFDFHISNDSIQLKCDFQVIITENDLSKLLSENYYIYISPKDVSVNIENGTLIAGIRCSGSFDKDIINGVHGLIGTAVRTGLNMGLASNVWKPVRFLISKEISDVIENKTGIRIDVPINKLKLRANNKSQYQLDMLDTNILIKENELFNLLHFIAGKANEALFVNPKFLIEKLNFFVESANGNCILWLKTDFKIDCT